MTMTRQLNLTTLEREIFNHRLSESDCICDALMDRGVDDDPPPYTEEQLSDVIDLIEKGDLDGAFGLDETAAKDVLWDIVDGSTYYGCAKHEVSDQKLAAIAKAGRSLAAKVEAMIGRPVHFPEH